GEIPPHQRFYYLELLRRADWLEELPECADIRLAGVAEAAAAGRAWLRDRGVGDTRWIGVSPGAAFGGAKRWLPERFAAAAKELAQRIDARVAVFGSGAERELGASIAAQVGAPAVNFAGETSLAEYIDLAAA